jgi:3-phenylpropionate/trans-cinnamate dioxygenase ferredoxin reductase subunit
MKDAIVVIGGGHAAATLCGTLAEEGLATRTVMFSDESHMPYERPLLSKAFLAGRNLQPQTLGQATRFADSGLDVKLGQRIAKLDRARRLVVTADGSHVPYSRVVLAVGATSRRLPGIPENLDNVLALRSVEDAIRLRSVLSKGRSITIVGAGFIGLEVAATARQLGCEVTVLEVGPRILGRAVSATMAEHVRQRHTANGIRIRTGVGLGRAWTEGSVLTGIEVDGRIEPVELLLVGIGAIPNVALAEEAGILCNDGILVDAAMRTSDPDVLAIGDCARYDCARYGRSLRLESVQSANDQASAAAATIAGRPGDTYGALPWFWSDQGDLRLQMTGLFSMETDQRLRLGKAAGTFSIFHFSQGNLRFVESLNASSDHAIAKKLIANGKVIDADKVGDLAVPLRAFL